MFGGNYGGGSDLFDILMSGGLRLLEVSAVHHWSYKAFLKELRQNLHMIISRIPGFKGPG